MFVHVYAMSLWGRRLLQLGNVRSFYRKKLQEADSSARSVRGFLVFRCCPPIRALCMYTLMDVCMSLVVRAPGRSRPHRRTIIHNNGAATSAACAHRKCLVDGLIDKDGHKTNAEAQTRVAMPPGPCPFGCSANATSAQDIARGPATFCITASRRHPRAGESMPLIRLFLPLI